MKKISLRNPKGSRDWLPDEVVKQDFVRKSLTDVFELWGYRPIQTPILINYDTLSLGSKKLSDIAFKLIGEQGQVLVLRADLTTPIARVTAERLQGKNMPFRFYYAGKVFRYHARKTTNERELYQIGIELIGQKEGVSDLECLKILVDSLNKIGLKKHLVLVNHAGLWDELFKAFGTVAYEPYKALSEGNLISFHSIIDKSTFSKKEKEFWRELIQIKGKSEAIKKFRSLVKGFKKLKLGRITSHFENICKLFENNVEIDLSLTSDIDYYTGIYFEAITPYLGRNIGGGGRYDRLIEKFGLKAPAIGFSLCLEDVLLALEKQGKTFESFTQPKLIKINKKNTISTFKKLNLLHKKRKHATIKS